MTDAKSKQTTASCATTAEYQSLSSASLLPSRMYLSPNIRRAHNRQAWEPDCAAVAQR